MNETDDLPTFQTSRNHQVVTPEAATSLPSSDSSDDGSHLDAIVMPDLEGAGDDPDAPIVLGDDGEPVNKAPAQQIDRDAFFLVFCTAFDLPGQIMPDFRPLGIQPEEKPAARAASDAAYSLLEIYYPAALMPQSETLAHLLVLGPFLIGKALVVRHILAARNAKPVRSEPTAEPEPAEERAGASDDWHLPGQAA